MPRTKSSINTQKNQTDQNDVELGKDAEQKNVIEAKDTGLQLFTTIEKGWPRANFTAEDLVNDLQDNKIKFTYEHNLIDDEELLILINKRLLKGCWNKTEKDEFRIIRSGLVKDRSPLERRDPRARRATHYE